LNYSLFKKKLGTNTVELVKKLEIKDSIIDFCYIDGLGFVFIHGNSIGYLDITGNFNPYFIRGQNLNNPISLCYSKYHSTCFVFDNNGKGIKYFKHSIPDLIPFLGSVYQSKLDKLFPNTDLDIKNIKVEGAQALNGDMFLVNGYLNKCFCFSESEFYDFTGSNKEGYSSSNDLLNCSFSNPQGIAYYMKALYIADTGNHCIRKIENGNVKLIAGHPLEYGDRDGLNSLLQSPLKIRVKGGIGCFIDNDKIKHMVLSTGKIGIAYESNNIISIELDSEKNLYILEEAK